MSTISDLIKAEAQQLEVTVDNAVIETQALETATTETNNAEAAVTTNTETTNEENVSSFNIPTFGEEQVAEPTTQEQAQQNVSSNWQDIIKKVDKKEIAKELGITEFALELNEYISNGGNAADYIAAKGIDWNKVDDVELIYNSLKEEFPEANPQQLQRLFSKKYNQSELADDEDREDGLLMIKRDAKIIRSQKIEHQSKFKIPEQVQQVAPDTEKIKLEAEKAQVEQFEKVKSFYEGHQATKSLMESKRVTVKFGDKGSFNFNIDKPELITQMLLDGNTWQQVTSTKQGEPDVEKLQKIALYAANPNYDLDIYNYAFAQGRKSLIEEGQNAKRPIGTAPSGVSEKGMVIKGTGTLKQHMTTS